MDDRWQCGVELRTPVHDLADAAWAHRPQVDQIPPGQENRLTTGAFLAQGLEAGPAGDLDGADRKLAGASSYQVSAEVVGGHWSQRDRPRRRSQPQRTTLCVKLELAAIPQQQGRTFVGVQHHQRAAADQARGHGRQIFAEDPGVALLVRWLREHHGAAGGEDPLGGVDRVIVQDLVAEDLDRGLTKAHAAVDPSIVAGRAAGRAPWPQVKQGGPAAAGAENKGEDAPANHSDPALPERSTIVTCGRFALAKGRRPARSSQPITPSA